MDASKLPSPNGRASAQAWITSGFLEAGYLNVWGDEKSQGWRNYKDLKDGVYLNSFGFTAEKPREARFVPLVRMSIPDGVASLDQAAARLGTDAARLRALNPAYRQGRIVAGAPRDVLAPATALAMVTAGGLATGTPDAGDPEPARTHIVRRGDTLSRIASRYGVPLSQLFSINGLGARSVLHPGQVIRLDP